jgi:glycosyltransferase involved in cell wall biosynthesis
MNEAPTSANSTIKYRKAIGHVYLREGRLQDAIHMFVSILRDEPHEVDTLVELGNLYLASGDGKTAARLFRTVQSLDVGYKAITNLIDLAANEQTSGLPEEADPAGTEATTRLLERLSGQPQQSSDHEMQSAYDMLQRVISSPNPGVEVAKYLNDIERLLPALLDLNIRQARTDGQHTVADALQTIRTQSKPDNPVTEGTPPRRVSSRRQAESAVRHRFRGHVLVLLPDRSHIPDRLAFMASSLRKGGAIVTFMEEFSNDAGVKPDLVVFSPPHLHPPLIQSMTVCSAKGIPILLDLDTDYENLPIFHPDYAMKGLGRQSSGKAYTTALVLANMITTPSRVLAENLRRAGYAAEVLPDSWDSQLVPNLKPVLPRSEIYIGWLGRSGLMEDFASVRRVVLRVLNEFENTRLVVIGNMQAYQLLEGVPTDRKIFLPENGPESRLVTLRQLDILLVPLNNHPFNNALPDSLLMEAGILGIPWIASPMPAFVEWKTGGLVAGSRDEWHTDLRQLIMDPQMRQNLGLEGKAAAAQRELNSFGPAWMAVIEYILADKSAKVVL